MSDVGLSGGVNKQQLIKSLLSNRINVGVNIEEKVMTALQLNVNNTREKRREIARKAKISWDLYRALEKEIGKRMASKVDIRTGKTFAQLEEEKNEIKTEG